MKRLVLLLTSVLLLTQLHVMAKTEPVSNTRCLVVYYSYSGVTKSLAEYIADDCNGTLLEVVDHGNYPRPESSTTYNYANNERSQIDAGNWPEINTSVEGFNEWDVVFICTPLWNGKMANPMLTFLHNHADKLAGKQVALAVTSWSSGISGVVTDAHNYLPESTFVGNPLHINYNNRPNMSAMASEWVNNLEVEVELAASKMRVIVGDKSFTATLADNATGEAFADQLPLTLDMNELNGNEKYYYLNGTLPNSPVNPGTIHAGDIMLYGSSCVVLFYKTFETSYSYTRIGSIDDPTGLAEAVGSGQVTVKFVLPVTGDVNCDGELSIGDVTALITVLLSGNAAGNTLADVNGDGETSIGDVSDLINMLLNK